MWVLVCKAVAHSWERHGRPPRSVCSTSHPTGPRVLVTLPLPVSVWGRGFHLPTHPLGQGTESPPPMGGTDAKSEECSGLKVQVLFHTDLEFHRVASSVPTCYSQKQSDGHWAGTLPSPPEPRLSQVWWKTSWWAIPSGCLWQSLSSSLSYFHQILCFLNSFGRETSYLNSWLVSYSFRIVYLDIPQMLTGHPLCVRYWEKRVIQDTVPNFKMLTIQWWRKTS